MAFAWHPIGMLLFAAILVAGASTFLVYQTRPTAIQNRRLSVVLGLELMQFLGWGFLILQTSPALAFAGHEVVLAAATAHVSATLLFVSTLSTPLVLWLRPKAVTWSLRAVLIGAPLPMLAMPQSYTMTLAAAPYGEFRGLFGPAAMTTMLLAAAVSLFAFAAATHAIWAAPSDIKRKRSAVFALALGVRLAIMSGMSAMLAFGGAAAGVWALVVGAFALPVLTHPMLAYGILRYQLVDLNVRLKGGAAKTLVAFVVASVFLLGTELVETLVGAGSRWIGLLAASLIAATAWPLHRAILRGLDRLVPEKPERRTEVYTSAVESALDDGRLTLDERALLAKLQTQLNLSDQEVADMEKAARGTV